MVGGNFYIAVEKKRNGYLKYIKVEAESVENSYGLDLFVHRGLGSENNFFSVSEGVGGFALLGKLGKDTVCITKEEAIIKVLEVIEQVGIRRLRKMIALQCRRYGRISPRYRHSKKRKRKEKVYETIRSFDGQED